MSVLLEFLLPIYGMKLGIHEYEFTLGKSFFDCFDTRFFEKGSFRAQVQVDKKMGMIDVLIHIDGQIAAVCDRCLADIQLPVKGSLGYVVKYVEDASDADDPEVIWIHPDTDRLDVSALIHESIGLSIPMVKLFDCEEEKVPQCDRDVLNKLEDHRHDDKKDGNPVWDILKNIN